MTTLSWRAVALLVAVAVVPALHAAPFAGLSSAAVPVAVFTAAIIAALAFAVVVSSADAIAPAPAYALRARHDSRRPPARACDPDAAGHARPRAPGSISSR